MITFGTSLPNGMFPYEGESSVELRIGSGDGEKYILEHFPGLPYEVIKVKYSKNLANRDEIFTIVVFLFIGGM